MKLRTLAVSLALALGLLAPARALACKGSTVVLEDNFEKLDSA
jgi:hypothetical protein